MNLINHTPIETAGLRSLLYEYAAKANISTNHWLVEIKKAREHIHGVCYLFEWRIILWLHPDTKPQDIAYIWIHELQHTTPNNRRLFINGHGVRAQKDAYRKAECVVGIARSDVQWRVHKEDKDGS